MKRTLAVTFCLGLLATLGVVFTRVIAARVPEQRATLEKLITERTGLAVRFDNVRFAWDLDGTSAVFTRVEFTDPKQGRVHVLAPELRVEFDAWDFLRHHRFSLGHVTLASPDIELIVDPERPFVDAIERRDTAAQGTTRGAGEAALLHRYLGWTRLMPTGRIEVEGARVHLRHRGEQAAHRSFTLSQAVVSRSGGGFSAYGTMLLSQDVGQSLFVSVKLADLGSAQGMSGDLRFIARRVFLDKVPGALPLAGVDGRGTLDARLTLRHGRVESGTWQANARELAMHDASTRFDHVTLNGRLTRVRDDVLLDFTDLQLTRGARLERAPAVTARLRLAPDSLRVAHTTVTAERIPFMAAEFVTGLLAPRLAAAAPDLPAGWAPVSGELHELRFDSGERLQSNDAWELTARVSELDLARATDRALLGQLGGRLRCDARGFALQLDAQATAQWRVAAMQEARPLRLEGQAVMLSGNGGWHFEKLSATVDDATVSLDGDWQPAAKRPQPLRVAVAGMDRALLADLWPLVDAQAPLPEPVAMLERGVVSEGSAELLPAEDGRVNWRRSRGTLVLTGLTSTGEDLPRLTDGSGKLEFQRGGTRLAFDGGRIEDLAITAGRIEWPRSGAPRLHALLEGRMETPLVRGILEKQGLAKLAGAVTLETDARGEQELRRPELWRVSARVSDASLPLAEGLPPVEKLAGTIRYAQQLRGLSLKGRWLGGDVQVESRRSGPRAGFNVSGTADAAALLALTGGESAAARISGQLAWNGTLQRVAGDAWQISLNSNLAGVQSNLPAPFGKRRTRELPISAELRLGPEGVRDFSFVGRAGEVRGQVRDGVTRANFEWRGVSGQWSVTADRGARPNVRIESLDLRRAPAVLAAAAITLPPEGELELSVADLQYADRRFGLLQASLARQDDALDFSMDTSALAQHQMTARGRCELQGGCRVDFTADTAQLATLLRDVELPAEWPLSSLRASGALEWPLDSTDVPRSMTGSFELLTHGSNPDHRLTARATLANGEVLLADVQGTGPEADQVFRGTGRFGLLAHNYDVTLDYERVTLAAAAVPSAARERITRAWNALRGSAAQRGWTEAPETRRVQWHGTWD
ncbi:MAG TPA: hypothetical protein VFP37_16935 [Steroidobacteraceae bacterium]|nr:hypothetical protein [Steroidobacteraceae bacterium]